jgi:ArsR family transcriptional regulator
VTDICKKIQQLGKGISSPSRYTIIESLMDGPKTVTDLVHKVKLSQPAVSQHLSTLKSCGLVMNIKKGQEVYYSLNAKHMLEIMKVLMNDVEKCKN